MEKMQKKLRAQGIDYVPQCERLIYYPGGGRGRGGRALKVLSMLVGNLRYTTYKYNMKESMGIKRVMGFSFSNTIKDTKKCQNQLTQITSIPNTYYSYYFNSFSSTAILAILTRLLLQLFLLF